MIKRNITTPPTFVWGNVWMEAPPNFLPLPLNFHTKQSFFMKTTKQRVWITRKLFWNTPCYFYLYNLKTILSLNLKFKIRKRYQPKLLGATSKLKHETWSFRVSSTFHPGQVRTTHIAKTAAATSVLSWPCVDQVILWCTPLRWQDPYSL